MPAIELRQDEWEAMEAARVRAEARRRAMMKPRTPVVRLPPIAKPEDPAVVVRFVQVEEIPLEAPEHDDRVRQILASRRLSRLKGARRIYDYPLHPGDYPADRRLRAAMERDKVKGLRIYARPIGPTPGRRKYVQNPGFWLLDPKRMRAVKVPAPPKRLDHMTVAAAVCCAFPQRVTPESIVKGRTRKVEFSLARHICFYAMNQGPRPMSLKEIGRRFGGIDHTSVRYAVLRIKRLIAEGKIVDPLPILFPSPEANDNAAPAAIAAE